MCTTDQPFGAKINKKFQVGTPPPLDRQKKYKIIGDHTFLSLSFLFETLQTPSNTKLKMHNPWR